MYIKYSEFYGILSHTETCPDTDRVVHHLKGDQLLKEFEAIPERLVLNVDGCLTAYRRVKDVSNPTHSRLIKDAAHEIYNHLFSPTLNKLRKELLDGDSKFSYFYSFMGQDKQFIREISRSIMEVLDIVFTWESKKPCDLFIQALPISTMYEVKMELDSKERLPSAHCDEKDLLPIYLSITTALRKLFKLGIYLPENVDGFINHTKKLFLKGYKDVCILETCLRDKKKIRDSYDNIGSTEEDGE